MSQTLSAKRFMDPKPYIGIPAYKGVEPLFLACMVDLASRMGHNMQVDIAVGDGAVGRARNEITARFLKSDCTHLLFIDSDLLFDVDQVRRIVAHPEEVVGGFYPKKQQGPVQFVCNRLPRKPDPTPAGLIELKYIGTGFLRVARSVFEAMIERYSSEIAYNSDNGQRSAEYDFWSMGVYKSPDGSARWLSEDWYFCQRWLDLGGKVYGDSQVVLRHVGSAIYPLHNQEDEIFGGAETPAETAGAGALPLPTPATVLQ